MHKVSCLTWCTIAHSGDEPFPTVAQVPNQPTVMCATQSRYLVTLHPTAGPAAITASDIILRWLNLNSFIYVYWITQLALRLSLPERGNPNWHVWFRGVMSHEEHSFIGIQLETLNKRCHVNSQYVAYAFHSLPKCKWFDQWPSLIPQVSPRLMMGKTVTTSADYSSQQ